MFITDLRERLQTEFCDRVMEKVETCPEIFVPALEAMLKQCSNIHTDSHLASSMHAFSKYCGAAPALIRRGASAKKLAVKRLNLAGTRKIGVQPTATARRRPHMGRGGDKLVPVDLQKPQEVSMPMLGILLHVPLHCCPLQGTGNWLHTVWVTV